MKDMRSLVMGVLAIALVCGVAWVLEPKRQTAPPEPPSQVVVHRRAKSPRPQHWAEPRVARAPVQQESLGQEDAAPARSKLRPKPADPRAEAVQADRRVAQADAATPEVTPTPQDTPAAQETIQDQMAQAALAYVGVDSDVQTYWDEATSDPSLSDQEGQEMMEDSNEEDLSDPEDSATADLP